MLVDQEFGKFLSMFHILCLQETWLTDTTSLVLQGYSPLLPTFKLSMRGRARGSVIDYIFCSPRLVSQETKYNILDLPDSDHLLICLSIPMVTPQLPPPPADWIERTMVVGKCLKWSPLVDQSIQEQLNNSYLLSVHRDIVNGHMDPIQGIKHIITNLRPLLIKKTQEPPSAPRRGGWYNKECRLDKKPFGPSNKADEEDAIKLKPGGSDLLFKL